MKKILIKSILLLASISFTSTSFAACGINGGTVNILANDFPAIHVIVEGAEACGGDGVTVNKNHTIDYRDIQVQALTVDPAEYSVAIVANSSIIPLLNAGLLQPLDQYVDKYGQNMASNQLIRIDGKIYAVAFMVNTQHFIYRDDILKQVGVTSAPKTYEEVLKVAKKIRDKGIMKYPMAGTYKAGWNVAEEFVNMYLGHGGDFFESGTPNPSVNNDKGIAALKMMKKLTEYMNPDYLTHDSIVVQAEWEAGNTAMINFWGARIAGFINGTSGSDEVRKNTRLVSAPTVAGGNIPAASLWWDGFTVAKNLSDQDAEASFRAMANGVDAKITNANPNLAAWIVKGSNPGPSTRGVTETLKNGARPYPLFPYMGIMHTSLGAELPDFFQGKESAEKTLADVEAAYISAAREKGFL